MRTKETERKRCVSVQIDNKMDGEREGIVRDTER